MKKNIVIIILSIIIVFLIYHVMNPAVVTERRATLQNKYSDTTNFNESDNNSPAQIEFDNETLPEEAEFNNDDTEKGNEEVLEENNNAQNKTIHFPKKIIEEKPESLKMQKEEHQNIENTSATKKVKTETDTGLTKFIKNCKPYKETLSAQYMGIDMDYEIEIAGWINNKCVINFTSKANGITSSFEDQYGISSQDLNLEVFAPKIRCEFTKTQLLLAGDSILQENERNSGKKNNMLKDPNDITFPEFTELNFSDYKLLQILMTGNACKIINLEDLKKIFSDVLNF